MSQQVEMIVNAQWVVTVDEQARVLKDHAIIVDQAKILAIEPIGQHDFTTDNLVERPNHIILPGLINAHTHAAMSLFRGLADDLPLMSWLNDHIWPAEGKWVNENFVHDGTQLAMAEMIRGGTTCFNDMYFFPNVAARVANEAHMRASFAFPILDFPSAWAQNADEYIHKGLQLHDDFRSHDLININFGPHAPYTVSDEPLKRVNTISVETQMGIHIHLHETAHEVDEAQQQNGQRPIERMNDMGLLTPQFQAVHMTQLTDEDIELLAQTGTHVVHCPESNLKLASGFCPIAKLVNQGVNVALGTDGAASNNDLDMFGEMRTAALLAKGVAEDPAAIPAEQALQMATINGAKALGIDDVTGSLAVGKSADFIAVDTQSPETSPFYNPVSQLVYSTTADKVSDTWVAGKALMTNRQLLTLNCDSIMQRSKEWHQKIAAADQQN
ncbi:MAG: TRZ/ATZ family hydrolase [Pseudomonadales bacterium]|nr:TRZ/ATZ family hydrolase [Pseudomonadales bacterium]